MLNKTPDVTSYKHASEQTPNILTQKHVRSDYAIIKVGTTAEMPSEGNQQVSFFFDTTLLTMNYWDKSAEAWVATSAFS